MELPLTYTSKFQATTPKPRNEREEIVSKFLAEINFDRARAGFRPYTYPRMAVLLQGVPTSDLYPFFKKCEGARSFGKFFHWSLDPKNAKPVAV